MPNLSDKEKDETINLIKEGKALPKEFIYKLFANDEDVFLFWNGRNEEVTNVVLPFHSIEHVDEPRKTSGENLRLDLFSTDDRGRQLKGWTNKLIWGDNKLVLSSLVNGPLRDEIGLLGRQGIDPSNNEKKYHLNSIPGKEFTGLQLLAYMYAAFQVIDPFLDTGMNFKKEYETAKEMKKGKEGGDVLGY